MLGILARKFYEPLFFRLNLYRLDELYILGVR